MKNVLFIASEAAPFAKSGGLGDVAQALPTQLAKNKNVEIAAVDINEAAIGYLNENIGQNKLKGSIKTYCGDVREVSEGFKTKFDRIIMNLPGLAYTFLDVAINLIEDGGTINYYEFSNSYDQGMAQFHDFNADPPG